jgi:hypothetical protein
VWSTISGALLTVLRGHSAAVCDMAVSHCDRLLAVRRIESPSRFFELTESLGWCQRWRHSSLVVIGKEIRFVVIAFIQSYCERKGLCSSSRFGKMQ